VGDGDRHRRGGGHQAGAVGDLRGEGVAAVVGGGGRVEGVPARRVRAGRRSGEQLVVGVEVHLGHGVRRRRGRAGGDRYGTGDRGAAGRRGDGSGGRRDVVDGHARPGGGGAVAGGVHRPRGDGVAAVGGAGGVPRVRVRRGGVGGDHGSV